MSSTPDIMSYAYIDTKEELKERQKLDDELWDRAKVVAKKELREDEDTKEHALRHLREWINKNPDLENCRTGIAEISEICNSLNRKLLCYERK